MWKLFFFSFESEVHNFRSLHLVLGRVWCLSREMRARKWRVEVEWPCQQASHSNHAETNNDRFGKKIYIKKYSNYSEMYIYNMITLRLFLNFFAVLRYLPNILMMMMLCSEQNDPLSETSISRTSNLRGKGKKLSKTTRNFFFLVSCAMSSSPKQINYY